MDEQVIVESEIDLRHYLDVLLGWWREISLIASLILVGAIGLYILYGWLFEPTYAATATVAVIRQASDIMLDERFQTQSEAEALAVAEIRDSRRAALAGLATNGALAEAITSDLKNMLSEDEQKPALLLEQLSAELFVGTDRVQSDLIQLQAKSNDPIKAAAIANSWASSYVQQVNQLYGQAPAQLSSAVESELVATLTNYQQAQSALESFVATQQTTVIRRQLAEKEKQITLLQDSREGVMEQQLQSDSHSLSQLYREQEQLHWFLGRASHLQTQLEAGDEAAVNSNGLALLLLKSQLFTLIPPAKIIAVADNPAPLPNIELPDNPTTEEPSILIQQTLARPPATFTTDSSQPSANQLQFNIDSTLLNQTAASEADTASLLQDTTALVKGIELRLESIAQEIAALSATLVEGSAYTTSLTRGNTPLDQAVDALDLETAALKAQLEAADAQERQLVLQRDLAWDTYQTLNSKMVELNLASTAANSEVRFAAKAIPPADPEALLDLKFVLPLVLLAGLMLGVFVAFISTYLGYKPFFAKTTADVATLTDSSRY